MNKEQVKIEVTNTLRKVEAGHLPAFKQAVKDRALFEHFFGFINNETFVAVIEACNEFTEVTE